MKKRVKQIKRGNNFKKVILIVLIILGIILIFAFIDYLFHRLSKEYDVPSYYFRNKIIFGTLIGCISYYFIRNLVFWKRALVFSAIIVVLLQIRYYLEGYPKDFVFLFLGIHFGILLLISVIVFWTMKKLKSSLH